MPRDDWYRLYEDLRNKKLWTAVAAEFLGVTAIVVIGCGSIVAGNYDSSPIYDPMTEPQKANLFSAPKIIRVSAAFGFAVATVMWCIGHASGGHVNPSVTIGMLAAGKMSLVRAGLYVAGQLFGGIFGAFILKLAIPEIYLTDFGCTRLGLHVDAGRGVLIEFSITFILVLTYFASIDKFRSDLAGSIPLSVGLAVAVGNLMAYPLTGASMNPARSFGPMLGAWLEHAEGLSPCCPDHFVYWVGPLLGASLAGLLYRHVFGAQPIRRDFTQTTMEFPLIVTTRPSMDELATDQPVGDGGNTVVDVSQQIKTDQSTEPLVATLSKTPGSPGSCSSSMRNAAIKESNENAAATT